MFIIDSKQIILVFVWCWGMSPGLVHAERVPYHCLPPTPRCLPHTHVLVAITEKIKKTSTSCPEKGQPGREGRRPSELPRWGSAPGGEEGLRWTAELCGRVKGPGGP